MSPEQVAKDPTIGAATDIYSFAAVLFEVLCGRTAFTGEKVREVVAQIETSEPPRPSSLTRARIPTLLEELVLSGLRKDPTQRPPSMEAMVRVLHEDWRAELVG